MPREALHARLRREPRSVLPHVKTPSLMIVAFALGFMLRPHVQQLQWVEPTLDPNTPTTNPIEAADAYLADHGPVTKDPLPDDRRSGSGAWALLASATTIPFLSLITISAVLLTYITLRKQMWVQHIESSVTSTTTTVPTVDEVRDDDV